MAMTPGPADNGLQQERTALAWRRTGLALLVAAGVLGRVTAETGGAVVLVPLAFGAAVSAWVVASSLRRGPLATASHAESAFNSLMHDGRLPAALSLVAALLCIAELALVL